MRNMKSIIDDTMGILMGNDAVTAAELRALASGTVYDSSSWVEFHYDLIVKTVLLRARRGLRNMNFPITLYKGFAVYPLKGTMCENDLRILESMCRRKFPDADIDFRRVDADFVDIFISWN